MRKLIAACVGTLFLFADPASAQGPAVSYVQGVVVSADTNAPLAGVRVQLRDPEGERVVRTTHTDDDGLYYFPNTRAGEYRIFANRLGYVTAEFGQKFVSGPGLAVVASAGEVVNASMSMIPAGVITGRINDNGRGVGLADVVALKLSHMDGEIETTMVISDRTNDLGEYHLYWLPPGEYLIVAVVWDTASGVPNYATPDGDNTVSFYQERRGLRGVLHKATGSGVNEGEAHIPVYYPGTPDPLAATPVRVTSGGEVREINIDASPRPTYRVAGRISGIDAGQSAAPAPPLPTGIGRGGVVFAPGGGTATVRLYPLPGMLTTSAAQGSSAQVLPGGLFEIPAVVPGVYTLVATSGGRSARTRVEVRNSDVVNANLTLGEGYPVGGEIRVEGTGNIPPSAFRVALRDDPPFSTSLYTSSPIAEDGSFTIPQPPPNPQAAVRPSPPLGDYRVLVNPILMPPSATPPILAQGLERAYVRSITMGGVDLLERGLSIAGTPRDPIVVVIGTDPGSLEGRVTNTGGAPVGSARVALLPEGNLRFRVNHRAASTDAEGGFRFENVAPGDYELFAWEAAEDGAWQDPRFVQQFEGRGYPVTISEGTAGTLEAVAIPAGF